MTWRTQKAVLALRSFGRAIGVNHTLQWILRSGKYEHRFQAAMFNVIRPGDTVWDVGANVGVYTVRFSQVVGPAGRVIAFEPSPSNVGRLKEAVASLDNVIVMPAALGDVEGSVALQQGEDYLGATSRIVSSVSAEDDDRVGVPIARGDDLILSGKVAPPNVVKVDTEGFEFEVLRGLEKTLRAGAVRAVCVEVHFGLLAKRRLNNAPAALETLLEESGFALRWVDPSHVLAVRA